MFLLVASALAGVTSTALGWPCQRLNWGWRNVWSTCSIHSFAPAAANEPPAYNTGFRYSSVTQPPTGTLNVGGWYQPGTGATPAALAVPQYFCTQAAATGTGATANLRNRCRRAVDAYGALVRSCTSQLPSGRGPVTNAAYLGPDWAPAAGHTPHVTNVVGLTHASGFCAAPNPNAVANPSILTTPSNTCPGLMGWFTVVYSACNFANAPVLAPVGQATAANAPAIYTYFPLGGSLGSALYGSAATGNVGVLCQTTAPSATVFNTAGGTPNSLNAAGGTFRTSRCRKALDQFGRTAARCHNGLTAPGPAQSNGFSDPLRLFALGPVPAGTPATPMGLNILAPLCN